ncbi:MAG: MBL fold metallo-hydrolase [Rhodospirillaceae bacterium]|nr:MBL fold metallo-hydrolase [Rhodospirillaceae bacterium]
MTITLTFHGACATVTGSCYELRTSRAAVLIDCGMFQGTKTIKALNYEAFNFTPSELHAVVLTHAHIDHCGLIPKLTSRGYRGSIYATPGTADLLTYILPDSAYVQETEVSRLNIRNRQRGLPAVEPIYTQQDAHNALAQVRGQKYDTWFTLAPGIEARFWDAGHILGSASVELRVTDTPTGKGAEPLSILFSGDIGPSDKAFHDDPKAPTGMDYLLMESTYGDRLRPTRNNEQRLQILEREIKTAIKKGGMILMPAFAVERTQELLFDLDTLIDSKRIPELPIFVDSPLATNATKVFAKHLDDRANTQNTNAFQRHNIRYVGTTEESKRLNRLRGGAIIMAGSGMCDAGRIRHHLKAHLSRSDTTVILAGYQAPATLGRLLHDGEKMVRIHGEEIAVAARIRMLDEYSGHADQRHLLTWFDQRLPLGQQLFLVHGEESARAQMVELLSARGLARKDIRMPVIGETVRLTKSEGAKTIRVRTTIQPGDAQRDWHNDYAATVIALKQKLSGLESDQQRKTLLRRVEKQMRAPERNFKRKRRR